MKETNCKDYKLSFQHHSHGFGKISRCLTFWMPFPQMSGSDWICSCMFTYFRCGQSGVRGGIVNKKFIEYSSTKNHAPSPSCTRGSRVTRYSLLSLQPRKKKCHVSNANISLVVEDQIWGSCILFHFPQEFWRSGSFQFNSKAYNSGLKSILLITKTHGFII